MATGRAINDHGAASTDVSYFWALLLRTLLPEKPRRGNKNRTPP